MSETSDDPTDETELWSSSEGSAPTEQTELLSQSGEGSAADKGARPGNDDAPLRPESVSLGQLSSAARLESLASTRTHARYQPEGELGRGGMGAVLKVFDTDLRRNLAMKVILPSNTAEGSAVDPVALARFLEEAQVSGQLEHPGVVPVHELGVDAEGHVYFTMRLVRGRELKQILGLVEAGDEAWSVTRALGVFLKVCEAMAYAHDKGVVHRDLKPANVMVGKYGEVYVMDWGLARVEGRADSRDLRLDDASIASLSEVRTDRKESREGDSDSPIMTMDGAVVGTPAYMPPEQARGEIERVDQRSDVYSVGAMLYQLLSGQVPFVPKDARVSARTILMRVLEGPPVPIRALRPQGVAPELEAICDKAMAREPSGRYADMGELADDLRAFLEGRVVQAHRTGALVEFRKWVARNKAVAASLAAMTLALVLGLAAVLWVREYGRRELVSANLALEEALGRAETMTREAQANAAAQAVAEGQARAETQRATLAEAQATARAAELELVADFQAAQLSQVDPYRMGEGLHRALIDAAPGAQPELLEAELADVNFTSLALSVLEQNLFARTLEGIDAQFADQPLVRARLLQTMAVTLHDLGRLESAQAPQERALSLRREALGNEHRDTLVSITRMGELLTARGRLSVAEPFCREALEGARRVLGDADPDTLRAIGAMGILLRKKGEFAAAEPYYREFLASCRRTLGDEHPSTLDAINNMGRLLLDWGRFSEAEPLYREALEGARRRVDQPQAMLSPLINLGSLLVDQGQLSEAEPLYRQALEGTRRIYGAQHSITLTAIANLATLLDWQGQPLAAEPLYREALAGRRRVLSDGHDDTQRSIGELLGLLDRRAVEARAAGDLELLGLTLAETGSLGLLSGDLATSEAQLGESTELLMRALPESDGRIWRALGDLATAIAGQGRHAEAEGLLLESADWLLTQASAAESAATVQRVVDFYEAWERVEPGAGHGASAREWRQR